MNSFVFVSPPGPEPGPLTNPNSVLQAWGEQPVSLLGGTDCWLQVRKGDIGVDVVNGGDHSDTFITQVGRGLMFIEDFTQGEDKLLMVEGVTDGIDPVIKDYRDAWEDIRDHLQRAGLDPWEAEGIYHDAIDDFSNASVVYKDGDLVAVIDGVSANELSIDTRRNAIV